MTKYLPPVYQCILFSYFTEFIYFFVGFKKFLRISPGISLSAVILLIAFVEVWSADRRPAELTILLNFGLNFRENYQNSIDCTVNKHLIVLTVLTTNI